MPEIVSNKRILQGQQTKKAILEAASRCFAEKGYAACSMDTIAQAAGLSKGGLYAHFKSKEELFTLVIKQEHDRAIQRAQAVLEHPPYLDGLIWRMKECISNAGFPMDHRLWAEVLAVAGRDPSMKTIFLESERRSRDFFKELLRKGIQNNEINPALDIEDISILLFALGDGLIVRIADDPDFDFDRQFKTFETTVRNILKK